MFQNLCTRITMFIAASIGGLMLMACSSSDRQASPSADKSSAPPIAAETTPSPVAAEPTQTVEPLGMKVFIDPKTGQMRDPTPAELAAMERQSSGRKPETSTQRKQTEVKMRNGGTAIFMEDNPETPMKACTQADGSVVVDHDCQAEQAKPDSKGGKP